MIDRLDRLSAALNGQGREWLKLSEDAQVLGAANGKVRVEVVVDGSCPKGVSSSWPLRPCRRN